MSEHKSLSEALLAFQAEAPTLKKDATNPHFKSKFTSLDTIVETVKPLLAKHGLTWSTLPCFGPNGEPALRYKLTHAASKEYEADVMPLLVQKSDPQGLGSALTYCRRYSVTAVLNLVADDDDDGTQASQRQRAAAPREQAKKVLPVSLVNQLRQGYVLTGWDVPTLHRHLAQFSVNAVEELSIEQAQELLSVMSSAVEAREMEAPVPS